MTTVAPALEAPGPRTASTGMQLRLLNGFELVYDGTPIPLPMSGKRLVAFLALHNRLLLRSYVAGILWLDTPEERAHANLRSTIWRLQKCSRGLVEVRGQQLRLSDEVDVDLREAEVLARSALDDSPAEAFRLTSSALAGDLLPDWYEDWVLIEREHFRQLRLRALDALCERLTRAGRLGDALEVGLAALVAEPLRESAHRAVVRVHLAEGNPGEAIRQYRLCRRLLGEQLGVEPSRQMEELMGSVTTVETAT